MAKYKKRTKNKVTYHLFTNDNAEFSSTLVIFSGMNVTPNSNYLNNFPERVTSNGLSEISSFP